MAEILITSVRTYTSMLEVRGRSPVDCAGDLVLVTVTVLGQSVPSYEGAATITSQAVGGYRSWIAYASITPAYAGATDRVDPPCDERVIVTASQGTCATKANPEPIGVQCCADLRLNDITVSTSCNTDRSRSVSVQFTVARRNEAGEISVTVALSSPADPAPPEPQIFTLPVAEETGGFTATFAVAAPPVNQIRTYDCVLARVTAGKCRDDTLLTQSFDVPGCPCPAAPTGDLTIHETSAPFAAVAETTRDGVACVDRESVRIVAPDHAADPALEWTNATPVDGGRAAIVVLPADGGDVAVVARLGMDPCVYTLTKVLRRCADRCPKIVGVDIDQTCTAAGAVSATISATVDPTGFPGTFTWEFGDSSPAEQSRIAAMTHSYPGTGGTFAVRVTFTPDDATCTASAFDRQASLNACPQPPCPTIADVRLTGEVCVAGTDASTDGSVLATFDATTNPAAAAGSYAWNFGDGSADETSASGTRNHTYTSGGTKTVKVTFTPQDTRCPATSTEKPFPIATCAVVTPPFDQCCLFVMILILMGMAAGAVVFPLGLCALFSGAYQAGIVIAVIGFVLLVVSALALLVWLVWCATVSANCTLVRLFVQFLLLLTAIAGVITIVSIVVDLALAKMLQSGLLCGIGVTVGVTFDTVYFAILLNVTYFAAMVVGCLPWWDGTTRSYVPGWLTGVLTRLRSVLPGCPL